MCQSYLVKFNTTLHFVNVTILSIRLIITYYQIGTIINQRKTWGNRYIKMLASDLKEYGKGYSTDQLKRMARFASYFSESEISAQAVHQIPWSTLSRVIIQILCLWFPFCLPPRTFYGCWFIIKQRLVAKIKTSRTRRYYLSIRALHPESLAIHFRRNASWSHSDFPPLTTIFYHIN